METEDDYRAICRELWSFLLSLAITSDRHGVLRDVEGLQDSLPEWLTAETNIESVTNDLR